MVPRVTAQACAHRDPGRGNWGAFPQFAEGEGMSSWASPLFLTLGQEVVLSVPPHRLNCLSPEFRVGLWQVGLLLSEWAFPSWYLSQGAIWQRNEHANKLTLWRLMGTVMKAGHGATGAPRNEGPHIAEGTVFAETWSTVFAETWNMRKNVPDTEREGGQVPLAGIACAEQQ